MGVFHPAALAGAGIGLVMGFAQYVIAVGVIERLIEAAREEEGPAEDEVDFARKVAVTRRRLFWGTIVGLPVAGYGLGQLVGRAWG